MVDASGNVLYYLNGHLGSARAAVDESGWVAGAFVPISCIAVFTVLVETATKVTATLPRREPEKEPERITG